MYQANDLPHWQYVIRHLSTYSSKPTEKSIVVLRHLVAYLARHGDISVSLKWTGRCSGIYHGYPDISQSDNVLEIFTGDWASDRNIRRSVSCCVMFLGSCLLFSASRTQKVSLSSAEAEVFACSSGASDGILLSRLIGWLIGRRTWMFIYTDSSGAKGILQRQGVGRLQLVLPCPLVTKSHCKWLHHFAFHQWSHQSCRHRYKEAQCWPDEILDVSFGAFQQCNRCVGRF